MLEQYWTRRIEQLAPAVDHLARKHRFDVLVVLPVIAAGGRLAGFDGPPPAYRSRVAFVSQDRPTVAGSPRDHLDQVLAFGAQRHRDPVQVRSSVAVLT